MFFFSQQVERVEGLIARLQQDLDRREVGV